MANTPFQQSIEDRRSIAPGRKYLICVAIILIVVLLALSVVLQRNRTPMLTDATDIYRDAFPLTPDGQRDLKGFAAAAGFQNLLLLKEFGGRQQFSEPLCEEIYQKYNAAYPGAALADERCHHNLAPGQNTYDLSGIPLVVTLQELDHRYLLLLVDEEGLSGNPLFSYVYNLQTKSLFPIDRRSVGPAEIHYQAGTLIFSAVAEGAGGQVLATYDLTAGRFTSRR